MAATRNPDYVMVYSNGTDGSAALAGSPIAGRRPRPMARPQRRRLSSRIVFPRWVYLIFCAFLLWVMFTAYGNLGERGRQLDRDLERQRYELAIIQAEIGSLQEQLEKATNETRIHSIAVNRLGMQRASDEAVYTIPEPVVAQKTNTNPYTYEHSTQTNDFDALRTLVGTAGN